jgi:hypothetical protein
MQLGGGVVRARMDAGRLGAHPGQVGRAGAALLGAVLPGAHQPESEEPAAPVAKRESDHITL